MVEGDRLLRAFVALRERIERVVLRVAPPEEVEDIVQETYVRVCQAKNKDSIREPRSFLFRTAQNLALDHMKRAETRLTSNSDLLAELEFSDEGRRADGTLDQVEANEKFGHFCEAVRRLPKQVRRAFVLKKVYGHTQREIAEIMNISENVVENYIAQGMKRCEVTLSTLRRERVRRRSRKALSSEASRGERS